MISAIKESIHYQCSRKYEEQRQEVEGCNVEEWLDCGNKDCTVYTNRRMLEIKKGGKQ
jgi:hypothetical protein